jgi:hypothetical protein
MSDIPVLLAEYLERASKHAVVDYASSASVRDGNVAAHRLNEIAELLHARDVIESSLEPILQDPIAGIWAAHHLIEVAHAKGPLEQAALAVIASVARGSSLNAAGEALWLRNYRIARKAR